MEQEFYNIAISQKRLFHFMELELGVCPTTLEWMSEHNPFYSDIKGAFVANEAYEQAAAMAFDENFIVFFSLIKLDGYPLLLERKESYHADELRAICAKSKYPFNEAFHYCIEDRMLKEAWGRFIDEAKPNLELKLKGDT